MTIQLDRLPLYNFIALISSDLTRQNIWVTMFSIVFISIANFTFNNINVSKFEIWG